MKYVTGNKPEEETGALSAFPKTEDQEEEHLSVDTLLDFVTLSACSTAAVRLCASVNCHIRGCSLCLQRVRAFQDVHDAFIRLHSPGDFKTFAADVMGAEAAEWEDSMDRE